MLSGLNHLTLAVTDLNRSVNFYHQLLHLQLDATWDNGAYLSLPGLWLCLSLSVISPRWCRACARQRSRSGATTAAKALRSTFSTPMATNSNCMWAI